MRTNRQQGPNGCLWHSISSNYSVHSDQRDYGWYDNRGFDVNGDWRDCTHGHDHARERQLLQANLIAHEEYYARIRDVEEAAEKQQAEERRVGRQRNGDGGKSPILGKLTEQNLVVHSSAPSDAWGKDR